MVLERMERGYVFSFAVREDELVGREGRGLREEPKEDSGNEDAEDGSTVGDGTVFVSN